MKKTKLLIIALVLMCSILGCTKKEEKDLRTPEKKIMQEMKRDQENLIELYDSASLCTKEWTVEYRKIAKQMQEYKYEGNDPEIIILIKETKEYGKAMEKIAILVEAQKSEEAIKELKELQTLAIKNENELNRLYDKNNQ